jgi:hypothetical protein
MIKIVNKPDYGQLATVPVDPAEKRKFPRFPFSATVEVIDTHADIRIIGRLSDISQSGCYVDTISPFAQGATVSLKITRGSQSFKTLAEVVYSTMGMGMGLLFTTTEPDQLRALGYWLSELRGEKVIEQPPAPITAAPQVVPSKAANGNDQELRQIVGELVALLNGKSILDDSEGMALLRELSK